MTIRSKNLPLPILFCLLIFTANSFSQQNTENQTTAEEDFKVNITEKKVAETKYESKVEVAVKSETNPTVTVNVGATVKAEQITLTMKNIFGDVRFRGSLEKILNQINLPRPPKENK
jgi:hypothetical protein